MLTLAQTEEEILSCPLNVSFLRGTSVTALSLWSSCSSFKLSLCLLHHTIPRQNSLDTVAQLKYCYSSVFLKKTPRAGYFPTLMIYLSFSSIFLKLQWIHGFYKTVFSFALFWLYSSNSFKYFILISGEQWPTSQLFHIFLFEFCLKRF